MKMKIVLLIFVFSTIGAMDEPGKLTRKRRAESMQTPSSKSLATSPQNELFLSDLPLELQTRILNLILNASGPTNAAKLFKASENLRNYMMINKDYYAWLNTPLTVNGIIRELAKRYTAENDFIAVVLALATDSASKWLANKVFDAFVLDPQNYLVFANDGPQHFILRLLEHLHATFTNNQADNYALLTKHIEPRRKAWLLNNITIQGRPLLSYLIAHNRMQFFDRLLAIERIDVDKKDVNGNTPLMAAIEAKNMNALQKLIDVGALVNTLNKIDETPLMKAIEEENMPAAQLLVNEPLTNLNAGEDGMNGPLHKAIEAGNHEMFDLLLRVGLPGRLDISAHGIEGETPLIKAVSNNFTYFVDELLKKDAHINSKNDFGQTALMIAAQHEDMDPLWLLLKNHANVNERDNDGHTALWHARGKNRQQNVHLLEQAGAQE